MLNLDFYLEIKLEDLCENANLVLNKLTEKLNIKFDKNMLNYDLSKSNIDRLKKIFDENDQKFLNNELLKYTQYYKYQK